jgi:hypothetical protein
MDRRSGIPGSGRHISLDAPSSEMLPSWVVGPSYAPSR